MPLLLLLSAVFRYFSLCCRRDPSPFSLSCFTTVTLHENVYSFVCALTNVSPQAIATIFPPSALAIRGSCTRHFTGVIFPSAGVLISVRIYSSPSHSVISSRERRKYIEFCVSSSTPAHEQNTGRTKRNNSKAKRIKRGFPFFAALLTAFFSSRAFRISAMSSSSYTYSLHFPIAVRPQKQRAFPPL